MRIAAVVARWWRTRRSEDRGSSPVELAIVAPAVLLFVLAAIQIGLIVHANTIAMAAAQQGVDAARAYQAGPDIGNQRAQRFADTAGADFLRGTTVRTTTTGNQVSVTVTAKPLSILPGHVFTVSQTASGPREQFTTAGSPP